jgi:hypothetical protein
MFRKFIGGIPPGQQEPAQEPAPQGLVGTVQCWQSGCINTNGVQCSYVDRRGARCATGWCPDHQLLVQGAVYCRRHLGIVNALLLVPPEEREFPDITNRAPSLSEWMANRLDPSLRALMDRYVSSNPDCRLVVDVLHLVISGVPRVRGWEHKWRLVDHTGPRLTVAIRVEENDDRTVHARVEGHEVAAAVPPWIIERTAASPEEDDRRRQEFDQRLVDAIAAFADSLNQGPSRPAVG